MPTRLKDNKLLEKNAMKQKPLVLLKLFMNVLKEDLFGRGVDKASNDLNLIDFEFA